MTTYDRINALCKERGIWSKLKDKKKAGMIAGLRAADANGDVEDEEDNTEEGGDVFQKIRIVKLDDDALHGGTLRFFCDLTVTIA